MRRLLLSFKYATEGIITALKSERNLKIHFLLAVFVLLAGSFFRIHPFEWLILVLTIGGMIGTELVNTAIEKTVDMASPEYHPLAKQQGYCCRCLSYLCRHIAHYRYFDISSKTAAFPPNIIVLKIKNIL